MAIRLNDNIRTIAPKPNDSRYYNNKQPYTDIAEVNSSIDSEVRYVGLTVNIDGDEYWYQSGIDDADLVKKIGSDGSGLVSAENGLSYTTGGTVTLGGDIDDSIVFTDTRGTQVGLEYGGDYSSDYTSRSLVDAGYVTGITSSLESQVTTNSSDITTLENDFINYQGTTDGRLDDVENVTDDAITGVTNGLTKNGDHDAELGGDLDSDTYINLNGSTLYITGSTTGSSLTTNYFVYKDGNEGDSKIMASNVDGGAYWADVIASELITGATNGVTKDGDQVILGGSIDQSTVFTDTRGTQVGLEYGDDYSSTFVDRSLVDKGYVDTLVDSNVSGITANAITGATNGLTKEGQDVILGGTLTGDTTIDGDGTNNLSFNDVDEFSLSFNGNSTIADNGNNGGIKYDSDYSGDYSSRSLVDAGYVTGITDTLETSVNDLDSEFTTFSGQAITGASNGLTKDGQDATLGGELTQETTLSGDSLFNINSPFKVDDMISVKFNTEEEVTGHTEGRVYYSTSQKSLMVDMGVPDVKLNVGEEEFILVRNTTASDIPNGTPVYISGAYNNLPTVDLAVGNEEYSSRTVGVTTSHLTDNGEGYVTLLGTVRDIDTSAYPAGTGLYVSGTNPGELTDEKPLYPYFAVRVGHVLKQDATEGQLLVDIKNETEFVNRGEFTGFTATTEQELETKLDESIFNTYTGTTDGRLDDVETVTDVALTGVTNGLTKLGDHVIRLGGELSQNTRISGNTRSLSFIDMEDLTLSTVDSTSLYINSKDGSGLFLKAQDVDSFNETPNDFSSSIGMSMDFDSSHGFMVYDRRNGSNQYGLEYADDYSENYSNRSLVDKGYVDRVATGLAAKSAVGVATTEEITLSGSNTVDGITVIDGMRVLVKDQSDGSENGIYVVDTGDTWSRSEDYNFEPSGEIANGDLVPVLSGDSNINTQWILTTEDPVDSGDTLTYAKFSQLLEISGADGIDINTVSGVRNISVDLASDSGLIFTSSQLSIDYDTFGLGLSGSNGSVDLNITDEAATGNEIPVKIDSDGNDILYVDSDTVYTSIGEPIMTANNGITADGNNVRLGGTLTGDTTIDGDGSNNLSFNDVDEFSLSFSGNSTIADNGNNGGIKYDSDYSSDFTDRSLVDAAYVHNSVTGDTLLTYENGITKSGDTIKLGGELTEDTLINYGAARLRFTDGAVSCIDVVSDSSRLHVEDSHVQICSCGDTSNCTGNIQLDDNGTISISTNNADTGITVTDSGSGVGIVYDSNYSSTFVDRSLVDKGYVDTEIGNISGITTSAITGATNGLTKVGQDAELGGELTSNTVIGLNTNELSITGGSSVYTFNDLEVNIDTGDDSIYVGDGYINLETLDGAYLDLGVTTNTFEVGTTGSSLNLTDSTYTIDVETIELSQAPSTGSNSDLLLVWNNTDNQIKTIDGGAVLSAAVTGATNGLETDGQEVRLGGTLTGDTTIFDDRDIQTGIEYGADYSSSFVDRSLVDKGYVDSEISDINADISSLSSDVITGATNGLNKNGQDAELGGDLTKFTSINLNGNDLAITGSSSASTVTFTHITYTDGNEGDGRLLASDDEGNAYWADIIESELITGATNGLTKAGDLVVLGGELTGTTVITDTVNGKGIEYADDYSSTFVDRSLVDKGYVDSEISSVNSDISNVESDITEIESDISSLSGSTLTGASNGLTVTNQEVLLGGSLDENTSIDLGSNQMTLTGTSGVMNIGGDSVNLWGTVTLDNEPSDGEPSSDSVLVWNSSTKEVNKVSGAELGDDNNSYSNTVVTSDVTLTTGDTYVILVDHTAEVTITLPSTPFDGEVFKIKDASGDALTYNIIVDGNGNDIDDVASGLINTDYGAIELIYNSSLGQWFTLSFVN